MGLLPIASYNYGAEFFTRVRDVLLFSIKSTFMSMVVVLIAMFIFANQILTFFCGNAPDLISASIAAMKIFLVLFPLGSITIMVSTYYQGIEKNLPAVVTSLARNIVFAIPLLFILPQFGHERPMGRQPRGGFSGFHRGDLLCSDRGKTA